MGREDRDVLLFGGGGGNEPTTTLRDSRVRSCAESRGLHDRMFMADSPDLKQIFRTLLTIDTIE